MTQAERVFERLKNDIITGRFEPGTAMSEAALGDHYKTGRAPIREAFRRLQDQCLLEVQPFRSATVPQLTVGEYEHLSVAARVIEPAIARLAAENATKPDLAAIAKLAAVTYQAGDEASYLEFLEKNRELHMTIAVCGGNPILSQTVQNLQDRLLRYYALVVRVDGYEKQLFDEHQALAAAIQSGDPQLAYDAASHHQEKTYERSIRAILRKLGMTQELWQVANKDRGQPARARSFTKRAKTTGKGRKS